ncbi:hypothetical protein [Roseococcus pinisoli]|uniref:hypothetical protein n=1 Tax=Roseococcus pinisoli TaxID=2835040 RepID=UPI001BD05C59|nr:hypothetical protein [Roseococcus pinisoli]
MSGGPLRVPAKRGASPPGKFGSALAVLLFLAFGLAGPLAIGMMPRDGQTQFAVIAAPWRGLEETAALVAAADGRIVDAGGLPNVIFAQSDSPAFVAAAYRAGAWLVLDPVLLRGCLQALGRASS